MATGLCQQFDVTFERLLKEINCPNSSIWRSFLKELKRRHKIISSDKSVEVSKPMTVFLHLSKRSIKISSNKISKFIDAMRYGDFEALRVEITNDSPFARKSLMSCMHLNQFIIARVLKEQYSRHESMIPDLATLFAIESMEDANLKCVGMTVQNAVQTMFISLVCMQEMYGKQCDAESVVALGALMIFRSNEISQSLQEARMDKLKFELNRCIKSLMQTKIYLDGRRPKAVNAYQLCQKLKNGQLNVEQIGYEIIRTVQLSDVFDQCLAMVLNGKVMMKMNQYAASITCFTASINASRSIYTMALSLRYMSEACAKMGQFVIALRLLSVAYKLCTMNELVICPSFVNKIYWRKRKRIKKELNRMFCSHCGRKGKLKCCTGCMTAVYCSKRCQKRDWKKSHRKNCDNAMWSKYYPMMKAQMIFTNIESL